MTQEEALKHMKSGENIFLSGEAGSGKSYTTIKFLNWADDNGMDVHVTASTGIAAMNISGRTIHSWAGLRNDDPLSEQDIDEIVNNQWTFKRIASTKILVIDEVSMLSAKLLENIDIIARTIKGRDIPFGGIQMIVVGDFYQLPPVSGDFAFKSEAWKEAKFVNCYLTEQHRQTAGEFTDVLNAMRSGNLNESHRKVLMSRMKDDVSELGAIRLETHNVKVDDINMKRLNRLPGDSMTYNMESGGAEASIASLKKRCLSPEFLVLKIGAKVMFTQNDNQGRWVNGTQGEVAELKDRSIVVKLHGRDQFVEVTRGTWEDAIGYGALKRVLGSISQFPLRLAYAITVHKSQGMTLDCAVIDITQSFAVGMAYVAISRVRSLEGLYIQGQLHKSSFKIDDDVQAFYDKIVPRFIK